MPLTTQIFIDGDPHLKSDTTFAVRSAIVQLQKHESIQALAARQQSQPFYTTEFDFVLKPMEPGNLSLSGEANRPNIQYAATVA
jgi:protocatechuate 3,4-dioxygenase beta subunit